MTYVTFTPNKKKDLSTLLLANGVTLVAFVLYGGSVMQVLWIYWLQSVIIGVVNVVRILKATHAGEPSAPLSKAMSNMRLNGASTNSAFGVMKVFAAGFFAFHYGFFHFVYAIFLAAFSSGPVPYTMNGAAMGDVDLTGGGVSLLAIVASGTLFALHHYFSYVHEKKNEKGLMASFSSPYKRILPMHMIIIVGPMIMASLGSPTYVFALFIALKTAADLGLFKKRVSHPLNVASNG